MKKRILSLLLAFVMILGMFPVQAFAEEETGPKISLTLAGYAHGNTYSDVTVTTDTEGVSVAYATIQHKEHGQESLSGYLVGGKQYYLRTRVQGEGLVDYTVDDLALDGEKPTKINHYTNAIEAFFTLPVLELPEGMTDVTFSVEGYEVGSKVSDIVITRNDVNAELAYDSEVFVYVGEDWDDPTETFEAGTDYLLNIWLTSYVAGDVANAKLVGLTEEPIALDESESDIGDTYADMVFKLPMLEAPAPTTYGITVSDTENGTVTADKTEAAEGDTVTLTVEADEDYELETLTVTDAEGKPIEVAEDNTFVMPASAVTVSASFKLLPVTYAVTISEMLGGTVTADKTEAAEGETVKLTVTPATGYELESLTYTPEDGEAEDITEAKSFTMPASSVTVAATFKAASPKVVLKLEGYEIMADAASVTLSGEDCNFLDSNGIYKAMTANANNKVTGSLLPNTQYYLCFNFNSISGADWSTLTKDDVSLEGLCDTAESLKNQYAYYYKNMTGWFVLPMLEIPDDANVIIEAENGKVYPSTYKATAGDTVTLTFAPNTNYVLDTVTVTDAAGNNVEVSDSYTFTMPNTAVTVKVVFAKVKATWTMGNASGKPGDTVQVTMSLESDIPSLRRIYFRPSYDRSVLSYETDTTSDITLAPNIGFTGIYMNSFAVDGVGWNYYYTNKLSSGIPAPQGLIFTISYKIAEDATPGEYEVTLVALADNTNKGTRFYDGDMNLLTLDDCDYAVVPGVVTVEGNADSTAYGITVSEATNGTVTANKTEAKAGDTVTLTVTPAEGYELESLTVTDADGAAVTVNADNTFTMPASAVSVSASFKLKPTYAVTVNPAENGSVTADKETATEGATVTLTVTPNKGYKLETLTVDGVDVTAKVSGGKYTFTMPAKAVEVSATFVEDPYPNRVNIKLSGYEVGKVAKSVSVKMYDTNGNDVTAGEWYCGIRDSNTGDNWNIGELKANTRYWLRIERYISGYKASDFGLLDMEAGSVTDSSGDGNFLIYIELPMLEAPAPATYDITVSATENGTVTADKAAAAEGETVTLTVKPSKGYALDTLTAGELELTKVNDTTYSFVMPASAVTVSASFKLLPVTYAVTISEMLGGTVTADKAAAAEGETVKLTVTPAQYYKPDTLTVTDAQGETVTLAEDNSFVMPAGAVTVSATFKQTSGMQQYFTVTVDGVEYPAQYIGVQYYDDKGRDCEAFQVNLPEGATSMTVACDYKLYVLDMTNTTIARGTSHNLPLNGAVTIYKLNSYLDGNSPNYCYLRAVVPSYGVTVNAGVNGKAEADKTVAAKGETVTLTVTPAAGYMVDTLTVTDAEGKPIEVAEDNTFKMPGSAVTVNVTFKEVPPVYYNVTIEASQNGTVTADKATAILNETVKLTATPANGYTLKSLTVTTADGAAIEVAEDNTFKMPAADVKVTATFKVSAKVYVKLANYELGKMGNQVKATMTLANGTAFTPDYWYIHTATDMNSYYKGELQADTTYWLCVQTKGRAYSASDFALEDMDAVSVVDKSDSSQLFFFIELPKLKAPAVPYAIDTSKIVDGTVTAKVGGNAVTEATAGSTVTLTAAPNEGFTLGEVRVLDATGAEITVTGTGENTYIFVMPESAVEIHALFRQEVAEDKSTLTLGEAADVLAGDKIVIPVNVANAPAGNFYMFDLNVVLPEGWTLIGAEEGADARLNSTDYWMPSPSDSGYGLVAQYDGNNGVRFPNGEVMKLVIQVPAGTDPGIYKLDAVTASLTMGWMDSEASSFAQYIDGHVTVKAGPTEKTELTTPAITDGMILAWEDMVESRNVPACQQDVNATVEYRLAETQEALETAEWILGTEPANYDQVYTDTIRWIQEGLKANTKYYLQIRYRAYNTNYFFDSDPCTTEFTTKAWIEEPVKITTGNANARPGDTFTVTMNFEHVFDNQAFISKDYDFKFNDECFTLQSINWTGDSGNKLPEGDVAELTFTVKDGVESGEYELALTSTNPFTLRYNRDGSGYYKHNREYPVNHTFTSGKITVLGRLPAPVLTEYTATDDTITVTAPAFVENSKVEYAISAKANETEFTWQESNVFENLGEKATYYVYARNMAIDKTKNGDSVVSAALEVKTVNPTATYTVASVEANPGKSVDVAVTLEHTIVKTADNFVIVPNAAEGLTFTSAKAGKDLGAGWSVLVDEGTVTVYRDEAAVIPTGEVIILTYTVSEDAEAGDLAVTLNAFGDDGCVFVNGETALRVDGTVTTGKVTVKALNPGDLNKDGVVDMTDYVCLRRYLASWANYTADTLDLGAADLNDDGNVDMKDAVLLSRRLAENI